MNVRHLVKTLLIGTTVLFSAFMQAETIWIDVRSEAEYQAKHIEGDLRISHTEIIKEISQRFPDKNTKIRLYCRSGNRAGIAKNALVESGYLQVTNVASIENALEERGAESSKNLPKKDLGLNLRRQGRLFNEYSSITKQ